MVLSPVFVYKLDLFEINYFLYLFLTNRVFQRSKIRSFLAVKSKILTRTAKTFLERKPSVFSESEYESEYENSYIKDFDSQQSECKRDLTASVNFSLTSVNFVKMKNITKKF